MSALESSITLEDVFNVVEAKRVPLAPELAGYLTLEIADGADAGGGDIDPKTVFVSEEGTVALVQPKKDVVTGEAESSIRALLIKLLDASGSQTPALGATARRKPGTGLPALIEELEGALIPVNRAAGRRALARLAREVKRVMLGVGRNATAAPIGLSVRPGANISGAGAKKDDDARPRSKTAFVDEAATAKRPTLGELGSLEDPGLAPPTSASSPPEAKMPSSAPLPPVPPPRVGAPPPPRTGGLPPPPRGGTIGRPAPPPRQRRDTSTGNPPPLAPNAAPAAPLPVVSEPRSLTPPPLPAQNEPRSLTGPAPLVEPKDAKPKANESVDVKTLFGTDEVDNLLDAFGVPATSEKEMSRDLKAIAGLDPTPAPDATTLAELTKDVGKGLPRRAEKSEGDSVEALLALSDASGPLAPPFPPRSSPAKSDVAPPASPIFAAPSAPAPSAGGPPNPIFGAPSSTQAGLQGPPSPPSFAAAARPSPRAMPTPAEAAEASARGPEPTRAPKPTLAEKRSKTEAAPPASKPRRRKTTTGKRAPKTGLALLILTLVILAGGAGIIWWKAPYIFTGHKTPPRPSASVSASAQTPAAPRCRVALVLSDVPANAEILLRMGQAPVDVERMPVGTRLEFVGTAEGYAPKRAVIKGESPWDKGPDGKPRIEVPIQLDPSKAKPGTIDPWPGAEPGSQVGGTGSPGTVHVVSNVRGAEVWLLAGLGPEARIEQLRCDADIDVLLAGPPTVRKRLHIAEKDLAAAPGDAQGNKVISVSAK